MQHYIVKYVQFGMVTQATFDADHYSISSAAVRTAHFYRRPESGSSPRGVGKDELIGSVASEGSILVTIDDEGVVIEAEAAELGVDDILDALADHLGVEEIRDEEKIRVLVRKA